MKTKNYAMYILAAVCIGFCITSPLIAEEENSVLKRVQRIDNAELAELIRMTKNNFPRISLTGLEAHDPETVRIQHENSIGIAKAVRTVTEKYAQIKLLDEKILIIDQKIKETDQKEIETELLLAKTTLEAERLTRIAELREAAHISPHYHFWHKNFNDLNSWIHLEVLDDTIRLINLKKSFYSNSPSNNNVEETLITTDTDKIIQYIKTYIKKDDIWPIRFGIVSTEKGKKLADDLEANIKTVIKDAHAEYDTEIVRYGYKLGSTKVLFIYNANVGHPKSQWNSSQGKSVFLWDTGDWIGLDEYISPKNINNFFLNKPHALPVRIKIIDKDNNKENLDKLTAFFDKTIKELGYQDFVNIEVEVEKPDQTENSD